MSETEEVPGWATALQVRVAELEEQMVAAENLLDAFVEALPPIVEALRALAEESRVNSDRGEHRRISKIADALEGLLPPEGS